MDYRVDWSINIEADDPEDAARQALGIMQDPESVATVLFVEGPSGERQRIDIAELDELRLDAFVAHVQGEHQKWDETCPKCNEALSDGEALFRAEIEARRRGMRW